MKLVESLAAGVEGGANGTATFVLRGTASSAASVLWLDFERTTQPGTNIISLDANGAAEIYTEALCDVTLKTSGGSTLRTITVGDTAADVEVISPSFTGTAYSGSPSGVSQPTTLKAVLDAWVTSSGSPDWKVTVNGTPTNLSTALASSAGVFVNVKALGAVGNGVADDTAAINSAINGAAGTIVFFPPGTYKVSTINATPASVMLMGSDPSSTIIRSTVTGAGASALTFADTTASSLKVVDGLTLSFAALSASPLVQLKQLQSLTFRNCVFDLTNCSSVALGTKTSSGATSVRLSTCVFTVGASSAGAINNTSFNDTEYLISDCKFSLALGFSGTVLQSPGISMSSSSIDGSSFLVPHNFINSATTTGLYKGSFSGNTFIGTASASQVCFVLTALQLTSNEFVEGGNSFPGFTHPTTFGASQNIYNVASGFGLFSSDFGRVSLGSKASVFSRVLGSDIYTSPSGELRFRKNHDTLHYWEDFDYMQSGAVIPSATSPVAYICGSGAIGITASGHDGIASGGSATTSPGFLSISTGANNGDQIIAHRGISVFTTVLPLSALQYFCCVARVPTITTMQFTVGFLSGGESANFSYDTSGSSTVHMFQTIGGVPQDHDTGLNPGVNFNRYEIFREGANFRFQVGATSFTMTGASTGLSNLILQVTNRAAASRSMDIDLIEYELQLSR